MCQLRFFLVEYLIYLMKRFFVIYYYTIKEYTSSVVLHLHIVTNFFNCFNYACVRRIRRPKIAVLAIFKLLLPD